MKHQESIGLWNLRSYWRGMHQLITNLPTPVPFRAWNRLSDCGPPKPTPVLALHSAFCMTAQGSWKYWLSIPPKTPFSSAHMPWLSLDSPLPSLDILSHSFLIQILAILNDLLGVWLSSYFSFSPLYNVIHTYLLFLLLLMFFFWARNPSVDQGGLVLTEIHLSLFLTTEIKGMGPHIWSGRVYLALQFQRVRVHDGGESKVVGKGS